MYDMDILALPDEVKLKIFEYLDGVTKVELSKVCTDFSRIYQDRYVIQRLNFARNYKTRLVHFKLRTPTPLYNLVTHLNVSSVYWIPSAQLRYVLLKFIELTYLNVTDTQLTFRDLKTVLSSSTKVNKLAISLKTDHCSDVIFLKLNSQITHFYVTYSSFSLRALINVLSNFEELTELWIVEPGVPGNIPIIPDAQNYQLILPKVKNKFVFTKHSTIVTESMGLLEQVKSSGNWIDLIKIRSKIGDFLEKFPDAVEFNEFNTKNKLEDKLLYLRKNGYSSMFCPEDLKVLIDNKCSYTEHYFKYMNLSIYSTGSGELPELDKCYEAFEIILFSKNMSRLRKLKLGCLFLYNKKTVADTLYLPLFKKPRIGSRSVQSTDKCLFARITNQLTEIDELEIFNDFDTNTRLPKWEFQPDSLKYISNWRMLKMLTITNVPFNNGKFFIEVTKNCPLLTRLKIKDCAIQDKISYDLCLALRYAKNLLDFRYERAGCAPMDELFNALTNCLNLERLYIQCCTTKSISKRPLETLLSVCEHLVFFFIYIIDLLETVCKTIKQSMTHFDIKPIQIFTIRGRTYNLNNITYDDIPSVHITEMVCQSNDFYDYLESF